MQVTRRKLLASVAAVFGALLSAKSRAQQFYAGPFLHNGGKAQVHLTLAQPYQELPFINACKGAGQDWFASSATEDANLLLDSRDYPTRMPSGVGAKWGSSSLYIYGTTGDIWVLDWPGTATLALAYLASAGGLSENIVSSNRREYTLTGTPTGTPFAGGIINPALLVQISITSMAANAFAGGQIRLFPKIYESQISAGKIFDPRFLARIRSYGAVSFGNWMNEQTTNISSWDDRKTSDSFSYFSSSVRSNRWCGTSTGTNQQVVNQPPTAISSWTDGQVVQWIMGSIPTFVTPDACTLANPGVFHAVGHGLNNGDVIEAATYFGGSSGWRTGVTGAAIGSGYNTWKPLTVAVQDADHFSLGVDTTTFGAYPGTINFYKQVTLQVGSLAPVLCGSIANTSALSQSEFSAGHYTTGTYNATTGRVLISPVSSFQLLNRGVPFEIMAQLALECRFHPWFKMPWLATDDYWTKAARQIAGLLPAALIAKWTYSNEVWNFTPQTSYTTYLINTLYNGPGFNVGYGYKLTQVRPLLDAGYAGSGKSFELIMEIQAVGTNTNTTVDRFQAPPYSSGDTSKYPINKCHAIAYGGYFVATFNYSAVANTYPGWADAVYNYTQGGASLTSAFNFYKAELQAPQTVARQNNTGYTAYQAGNLISVASNTTHIFGCIAPGTSAGSLPAAYASAISGQTITDGTAQFYCWGLQQPLSYYRDTCAPFWKTQANLYSVKLYEYEGGQSVSAGGDPNGIGIAGGFPATAPTSGMTVTVQNVRDFYTAVDGFLRSQQYADCITQHATDFVGAGGLFPSQYTEADSWENGYYWSLWQLNQTINGFVDATPTPAVLAFQSFNGGF